VSRASSEGASTRAATSSEACSLDRFTTREPSRSFHGEGHVRRAPVRGCTRGGSRRGRGRSTCAGRRTEHERPVCAAWSGSRDSYKPMVKASRAQRASEGIVVASSLATNNARGAKGPCGGPVGGASTHEGMTGSSGSNYPGGPPPIDKVRQLQRRLWVAAKRSPERRFHALMDRIWRADILWEAWRRVKRNRGSAGVDRETWVEIEQYGVERLLSELGAVLRAGRYRPQPVLRRYIPKADGRQRPLGIPTVRDRVVQMAATLVLEPIFEADFRASSYGFRPKRSATQALETLRLHGARGGNHVLDADIRDYFGRIDHAKLLVLVELRISDRRVLKLLRQWLAAGVMEDGQLGPVLSHGQCDDPIPPTRPLRRTPAARLALEARRESALRRSRGGLAPSFLRSLGALPPARDDSVSGDCVMLRLERPPGKPCAGNPHARFERGSYRQVAGPGPSANK
jgi:hypothetical protein